MAKRKRKATLPNQVDIIIPVFGRFDLLEQAIESIPAAADGVTYKLFLVDDFSPDQTAADEFYRKLPMNITVIRKRENSGFPATVNVGVERGRAAAVMIMNSDVALSPGAIVQMYETLNELNVVPSSPIDPADAVGVGIVAPMLTFPDMNGERKVQHAGIFFDLWANPVHRFIGWGSDNRRVNRPMGVQAVSGACLMITRNVWNIIKRAQQLAGDKSSGALNEIYGRGTYEDIELCIAARVNKYRVVYEPRAHGTHAVGASVSVIGGYPLQRNKSVFLARCGHLIVYDEWMVT